AQQQQPGVPQPAQRAGRPRHVRPPGRRHDGRRGRLRRRPGVPDRRRPRGRGRAPHHHRRRRDEDRPLGRDRAPRGCRHGGHGRVRARPAGVPRRLRRVARPHLQVRVGQGTAGAALLRRDGRGAGRHHGAVREHLPGHRPAGDRRHRRCVRRHAGRLQDRCGPGHPAVHQVADGRADRCRRPDAVQPGDEPVRDQHRAAGRRPAGDRLQPGRDRGGGVQPAARLRLGRPGHPRRRPGVVLVVHRVRSHDHAGLALHRDPAPAQLLPRV
ncbi:MAG: Putative transmembrane protein, partial [uncultured Pseudonocardia sp.]